MSYGVTFSPQKGVCIPFSPHRSGVNLSLPKVRPKGTKIVSEFRLKLLEPSFMQLTCAFSHIGARLLRIRFGKLIPLEEIVMVFHVDPKKAAQLNLRVAPKPGAINS